MYDAPKRAQSDQNTEAAVPARQHRLPSLPSILPTLQSIAPQQNNRLPSIFGNRSSAMRSSFSGSLLPISSSPSSSSSTLSSILQPAPGYEQFSMRLEGIPEYGCKSRVETHLKLTLFLDHPEATNLPWKKVRLPTQHMAYDKFIKSPETEQFDREVLSLAVQVVCPSRGNAPAVACFSCIQREYRRKHKKGSTASPYPDLNTFHSVRELNIPHEQERIILFNNYQLMDFSSKTIPLCLRFTCYCRHHEETRGFQLIFKLIDHRGYLVSFCTTPPIMITDDRKPLVDSAAKSSSLTLQRRSSIPILESIIPKEVSLNTGTEAVIVGKNLSSSHVILFGLIPASIIRILNSEALIVKIPPSPTAKTVVISLEGNPNSFIEFDYKQPPIDSSATDRLQNQDLICEPPLEADIDSDIIPHQTSFRNAAR